MFWMILAGIVLLALGVFCICKPDSVWNLTERWKSYRADEPTDTYVAITRIEGALITVVGIFVLLFSPWAM